MEFFGIKVVYLSENLKIRKMKVLSFLLVAFLLPLSTVFAQLSEAHIVYDIKMESSEPEVEAQLAMLGGSKLEIMFKDTWARQSFSMGSMMSSTTITNSETGEALILIDGMMGKFASKTTSEDISEEESDDIEVELLDETKEILGYTCKKAILIDEEGNESIFWYTDQIMKPQTDGRYFKGSIPGMPLEFSVVTPQLTMTMKASEFNKKVKKSKDMFTTEIPEGFQERNIDELQNTFGG